jgi:multiple sugar transport system substrate-binding protein
MKRFAASALCALLAACDGGGGGGAPAPEARAITVWWAQWAPADGLQELGRDFEKETGIKVTVHQIPWPNYADQVNLEFGNKETKFDIVIGDSQWIGRGATRGLYIDLTDWIKTAVDMTTVHPKAARYLCEYPPGSGRFWAAPCETDAIGIAYRRDWFDDPKEKEAFKAKYGRDLKAPDTWEEFRDIAEFFHRAGDKRYGCSILSGRDYDALTMGFEQVLYAFGGSWGDEKTYAVQGHINNEGAVAALDFFRELMKFSPPGGSKLDYGQCLEPFKNGSTAMLVNYFAFYPDIAQKLGDKVGFCPMPRKGDRRFASLGGQGMSISAKAPAARQELAKQFIKWFCQLKVQKEWIRKPAGFTANTEILKSDEFRKASPYNAAFADSLDCLVDFWNIPIFGELLAPVQQYLGEAVDGKKSSKEALDAIAAEHEKIFAKARADGVLPK